MGQYVIIGGLHVRTGLLIVSLLRQSLRPRPVVTVLHLRNRFLWRHAGGSHCGPGLRGSVGLLSMLCILSGEKRGHRCLVVLRAECTGGCPGCHGWPAKTGHIYADCVLTSIKNDRRTPITCMPADTSSTSPSLLSRSSARGFHYCVAACAQCRLPDYQYK